MPNDTAPAWPDPARPGVPLNAEKDGWHIVAMAYTSLTEVTVERRFFWSAEEARWWLPSGALDWIKMPPSFFGCHGYAPAYPPRYLGPCLTPSAQSAREAAVVAAGAREIQTELSKLVVLREWFGADRYARDYEYLDANFSIPADRVSAYIRALSIDTTALDRLLVSAQWDAFNRVLHWVNEQTEQMINKKHLYQAVMEMRPADVTLDRLLTEAREEGRREEREYLINSVFTGVELRSDAAIQEIIRARTPPA